jgi:multiple antibiotic resistance protein
MLDWSEYGKFLVALWALIRPIGAVPVFLSLTAHRPAERRQIGFVASVAAGVILMACVFVGQAILLAFGIDIPSFRIAGGLLILVVAFTMLHTPEREPQETRADRPSATANDSVAVVPLAIPILAGPGAISTVIVYAHKSASVSHHVPSAPSLAPWR